MQKEGDVISISPFHLFLPSTTQNKIGLSGHRLHVCRMYTRMHVYAFIIDDSLQLFPTSSYPNTMQTFTGTVDGRNPAPPGMFFNPVNNGMNYQPQLVSPILSINSIYILPISTIPVVFW